MATAARRPSLASKATLATQINEQTLSFIPKILAVGLTMSLAGGWMINTMVDYTKGIFIRIPSLFM